MQYRSVKGFSGWGQLGMLFVFTGVGFILSALAQLVIVMQVVPSGMPLSKISEQMLKLMEKPENVGYARLAQVVGTFFLFFVPAILFMLVCHGRNMFWLGFNKYINARQVVVGFLLFFAVSLLAIWLHDVSKDLVAQYPRLNNTAKEMEVAYSNQVNILSNLKSWGEFAMAIVIMAFFPALFEEVFFRGALQQLLVKWWKAPLLGIIVTSILFSVIHMSVYLFLSRAVMGLVLGLMYQRSRNLWVNIIAHFLNNSLVIIQMFLLSRQGKNVSPDMLDPKFAIWGGLLIMLIAYGLYILFDRVSRKNRQLVEFDEQDLVEKNDPFYNALH